MDQYSPNWLKQRAELTPDRMAIKTEEIELTFGQLYQRVNGRINFFIQSGVKKKQHIGIYMRNSIQMVETIFAIMSIGAVAVLLNTRLTVNEIAWQIEDSAAAHLICDTDLSSDICSVERIVNVIQLNNNDLNDVIPTLSVINTVEEYSPDQVATIMYTSGTTGYPKGVLQTYGNHWSSAIGSALNLGILPNDRWLLAVPLFHISGLSILIRSVIYGIGVILLEKFDPIKMNQLIYKERVTIVSVVTVMLKQMIEQLGDERYPSSFRCMLTGGGPVPKNLLEKCQSLDIPVYQTYGMTETSSQIVTLTPEYSMKKLGSAGKPLFSCQVKIMNDGKECDPFEEGEIFVKGPNVTKGYLNREEATKKALNNGWFATGDQGYKDADGFLFVLDRRSDLIISGGENVYPAEIEGVLQSHPSISEAGVVGIENPKWGQSPFAFVVLKSPVTIEELNQYCQNQLAGYKIPAGFQFLKELPRNASNKLLRRELKGLLGDIKND